jgi:DNA-binding transcriptional regulator YbjK
MPKEYMQVTDLIDEYVTCRALGHAWDENPTGEVNSELYRAAFSTLFLRCTRCHTERFDYLAADMTLFQRYYRYPQQYVTVPGTAKLPVLRAEMLRRSLLIKRTSTRRRRNVA